APANDVEEHSLNMIIARMAKRDPVGADRRCRLFQESMSASARRLLHTEMKTARCSFDVAATRVERSIQGVRELADELLIGVRLFTPNLVVEVRGMQLDLEFARELLKAMQQST